MCTVHKDLAAKFIPELKLHIGTYTSLFFRNACVELNRKSLMVEEAVEEVLDLVKKAAQQIKPTEINPDFEFLIAEGEFLFTHKP